MKARVLALFDRLVTGLGRESARAIVAARRVVESSEVHTYDDYANVMEAARQMVHPSGQCFGPRLKSHESRRGPVVQEEHLTASYW